jgi:hypothetical protein
MRFVPIQCSQIRLMRPVSPSRFPRAGFASHKGDVVLSYTLQKRGEFGTSIQAKILTEDEPHVPQVFSRNRVESRPIRPEVPVIHQVEGAAEQL